MDINKLDNWFNNLVTSSTRGWSFDGFILLISVVIFIARYLKPSVVVINGIAIMMHYTCLEVPVLIVF